MSWIKVMRFLMTPVLVTTIIPSCAKADTDTSCAPDHPVQCSVPEWYL